MRHYKRHQRTAKLMDMGIQTWESHMLREHAPEVSTTGKEVPESQPQQGNTGNQVSSDSDSDRPQSVIGIIRNVDAQVRSGDLETFVPIPTGFGEFDAAIGGGFKAGQIVLLSGSAGVGKTSLTLQI